MQLSQIFLAAILALAAAPAARADDQMPCAGYTGADLSGQLLDQHHEKITTLAPKAGSVLIPTGYGVTIYPGLYYVGPGLTLKSLQDDTNSNDNQYYYLTKAVAGGRSINLADLADTLGFYAFPSSGMGSFHCFKLGTRATPGKAFAVTVFYNTSRFDNAAISAHGSSKSATLTNLNGKKLLTFTDASPDDGVLVYSVDLDTGDISYDHDAVHGFPAAHKVVTNTAANYRDAVLTIKTALDVNFATFDLGGYPYNAPEESLVEVRELLGRTNFTSPF